MEITRVSCFLGVAIFFLFYTWKIINLLWFKPKKLEKFLKNQGLKGNPYRLKNGDLKERVQMMSESMLKPMNLSHDIFPRVEPFIQKCITNHGKNCFTWIGTQPLVHIVDPGIIQEVLANYRIYEKHVFDNPLAKLLGTGLLDAEGDKWEKHKKIINPAFHIERLKHMVPAFNASCNEMINKWMKILSQENSCEVDVWAYLQTMTSDAISRTAFGSSFEEGRKIFELQQEQESLAFQTKGSVYIPGLRFLPTKKNKRMKEIHQKVRSLIMGIINERVVAMKAGEAAHDYLLGTLLDANQKEMEGNKASSLSMDEIVE